jgi:phenylalanine-4-hydroxylase
MSAQPENQKPAVGLTTTEAPFIEEAVKRGELYISQPYDLYSEDNHEAWRRLFSRMVPRWEKYANQHFQKGIASLCLDPEAVPRLEDVNQFLKPLTGFRAKPVAGFVPAFLFFECLRNRDFPTTITMRRLDQLEYLPEPDIFHDIAGHVPMHTDKAFADTLVKFGDCAMTAARRAQDEKDEVEQVRKLTSNIMAMARFFWFTIEFGLMKEKGLPLKAYGSGLLSSWGELEYSVDSPDAQRFPLQLEWIINQSFEIHHYQPLYFVAESFDQVYEQVDLLEKWMLEGKLDNVAPGEPQVSEADLSSFLHADLG